MGHAGLSDSYKRAQGNGYVHKFPYANILDDEGKPTGQTIAAEEYDPEIHKGHLGCPDCNAKLKATPEKEKVLGTDNQGRGAFFSSVNLEDHSKDCELASVNDRVRSKAHRRLEFFNKEGSKLLYLNIPNNAILDSQYKSPLRKSKGGHLTGKRENDVATYSVKSVAELLKMSQYKDFSDPFYNDVSVYINEHRMPWCEVMMGISQKSLLKKTYNDVAHHHFPPKFSILTVNENTLPVSGKNGFSRVECEPQSFIDKKDPSGLRCFSAQPIISTDNKDVLEILEKGGIFLVHATPVVRMDDIHSISGKFREGASNNNSLSIYIPVKSVADIVNCGQYLDKKEQQLVPHQVLKNKFA